MKGNAVSKHWQRRTVIILGLLVAFALRVYKLGDQNVWWDEGLSVLAARESFLGATLWTAADVHPPLYFWLLWPWARLAGESEFALRYVTVMESMLVVAAAFPLGRRLSRRPFVGIAGLWLLALSRFHIWWSQEMRMYILAGLCSLLSLYFTARMAERKPGRGAWIGWILATTGALYTIYSSIILVPIENLFMLVVGLRREDRRRLWQRWIIAQLLVALLVLPWLAVALPRMRSWSVVQEPASLAFVLELNAVLLALGVSTDVGRFLLPAALVFAVLVAGLGLWWWEDRANRRAGEPRPGEGLLLLALGLLLPPLTIWLLTQPRALFYTPRVEARYLLPFAPTFSLLLAWGLAGWLRSRLRPAGVVLAVAVVVLFTWTLPQYYQPRYLRDDYATLTRLIWSYGEPDDAVVLVSGNRYPLFRNYYDRPPAPESRPTVYEMPGGAEVFTATFVDDVLENLAGEHDRIWLAQVERNLQDPEGLVEAWLAERYERALTFDFAHNNLSLFVGEQVSVTADQLPPQYRVDGQVVPGVELRGYDLATREFRPLDSVRVGLYLRVEEAVTLTVALEGEDGRRVALQPLHLAASQGLVRRQVEFRVTPYTPSQPYHFVVDGPGGQPLLTFGEVRVTHTEDAPEPARIPQPLESQVGEEIRLLGYRLAGARGDDPPSARPGETLELTLYWQTDRPLHESYHVFTHLLGAAHNPATGGPLWAQDDQIPLEGAYPTDLWLPGIPLADRYLLEIDPQAPAGDYRLVAGLYRAEDGERLPVSGEGADPAARQILLTTVKIAP